MQKGRFLTLRKRRIIEPVSSKRYKMACTYIEDSDQPVHPHSLIRFFSRRSMGSQGSNVPSGERLIL